MTVPVRQPIFIIGPGRSGTTLLYKLLSVHPETAWFSNYSNKIPGIRWMPVFNRFLDVPFLGDYLKRSILLKNKFQGKMRLKPSEAGNIYHRICGFEKRKRLTARDYNKRQADLFREEIRRHLRYTGRRRFVTKQTCCNDWLGLIDRIFPDAKFIHIIRDGRAVVHSLTRVRWWPNVYLRWLGKTAGELIRESGYSGVELAAEHWVRQINEILRFAPRVPGRYLEIRYEELCLALKPQMERIIAFCGLSLPASYIGLLPKEYSVRNQKWRKNMNNGQIQQMERILKPLMRELRYEI
jgi:hypothetical protein